MPDHEIKGSQSLTNLAKTDWGGPDSPRENKKQVLKRNEIRITFLDSGTIVGVGCRQIAFPTNEEAISAITAYVKNPVEEKERWENIFNKQD